VILVSTFPNAAADSQVQGRGPISFHMFLSATSEFIPIPVPAKVVSQQLHRFTDPGKTTEVPQEAGPSLFRPDDGAYTSLIDNAVPSTEEWAPARATLSSVIKLRPKALLSLRGERRRVFLGTCFPSSRHPLPPNRLQRREGI
jgi:hypothetical protein